MKRLRRIGSLYRRIARTYRAWAGTLLVLSAIVFIPAGMLDALTTHANLSSIDFDNGLHAVALIGSLAAITITALFGEVFYSGAVAISLTHPHDGKPPGLREIAKRLRYGRLISIDLLYGLAVAIGLLLFIAPGVAIFVWLALAGPIVEIEGRTVRGACRRSVALIRGHFWVVASVLIPIQIVGEAISSGIAAFVHGVLGKSLLATWAADSLADIALAPILALAAVIITVELIAVRDGGGPTLNDTPAAAPAAAAAQAAPA